MKRFTFLLLPLALVSACDLLKPTADPSPVPSNVVNYTAIGASDAIGYGGSVVCLPFIPCTNGTGYIQILERRLRDGGKTVSLTNLGIPGAVISTHVQAVGHAVGRDVAFNFLGSQLPVVPHDSTLVTIFTGGNDVNTIGAGLEGGLAGSDPGGYIVRETQSFADDLKTLIDGIKSRAPQARIIVLNLPNLGAMPYAAGYSIDKKRALQQIAVAFSAQLNALTSRGALVVDLMCDSVFYSPAVISGDGFHPNDAGYEHMADLIYPIAIGGSIGAPRNSCSQMTIF